MDDCSWREDAACASTDTEAFFPAPGDRGTPRLVRRVCGNCEVRTQCLEHALANDEYGIWGRTTEEERRRIKRKRLLAKLRRLPEPVREPERPAA